MSLLNTTSNLQKDDTHIFSNSFYAAQSQIIEPTELLAHSKKMSKHPYHYSLPSVKNARSSNAKRLADMLVQTDDSGNIHTLSEQLKTTSSLRSPEQNSFSAKSIKQRIGTLRPSILNNTIAGGEDNNTIVISLNNNPILRTSNSPPKGNRLALSLP